ncbi:TRASH domain-containing protein [Candidatus Woesearchaeota archaeon]|jgi:hypothetical protein|nr:TRASH domain-containing protein [Candidatus Woesearchaeota archaeon]
MNSMVFEEGTDPSEAQLLEEGGISPEEEAFMRGYSGDEDAAECDECGSTIKEKKVIKDIGGESYRFCCEDCAKEFAEGSV